MTTAPVERFGIPSRAIRAPAVEWLEVPVTPEDYDVPAPTFEVPWASSSDACLAREDAGGRAQAVRVLVEVLGQLRDPSFDFRTVSSIAADTGLTESQVSTAIRTLGRAVRTPVGAKGLEVEYLRLVERGFTRGERLRNLKYMLTRG